MTFYKNYLKMKIDVVHSFLVHPEKAKEIQTQIKGTTIPESGILPDMLKSIFLKAPKDCIFDIAFNRNDKDEQQNEIRDLIIEYLKNKNIESGRNLASKLQFNTSYRSGMGLLFFMIGKHENIYRLVISRFPADKGILAEERNDTIEVEYIEKIFMKNAKTYKSALYEDTSFDTGFWVGKAIDKQVNDVKEISDYWIKDFLQSDFATTSARGSRRLANALREVMKKSDDLNIKQEISAAIILAKGFNGNIINPSSFLRQLNLSDITVGLVKSEVKEHLFNEAFTFQISEFNNVIQFKTVELDNGALLTAKAGNFDEVFTKRDLTNNKVSYITEGFVIDERLRKTK
jgi:hypothetical protein